MKAVKYTYTYIIVDLICCDIYKLDTKLLCGIRANLNILRYVKIIFFFKIGFWTFFSKYEQTLTNIYVIFKKKMIINKSISTHKTLFSKFIYIKFLIAIRKSV